jgi:CelD/BcsL family acetyltransferase involved in cellulose biosynthesis
MAAAVLGLNRLALEKFMTGARVHVEEWDENQFLAARQKHEELLARSHADPLFQSWDWLTLWWSHFGKQSGAQRLRVLATFDESRLIGLLPLMDGRRSRYRAFRLSSASVLGGTSRQHIGVPTEYQDVIAESGRETEVLQACLIHFQVNSRSDELTIGWCHRIERWRSAFLVSRRGPWEYFRLVDPLMAYSADLSHGFESYLGRLSANARRSVFNSRRKLHAVGSVTLHVATEREQEAALIRLNSLHALRWGKQAFDEGRLRFHVDVISRLNARKSVAISELRINDRCVSVLYDLRAGQSQYNIQMGYDPQAMRSSSLGLLHLGYAIESAATSGFQSYDFLGGKGRKTDYKMRIATDSLELATAQMVRSPIAASLFRMSDFFRGRASDWRSHSRSIGTRMHLRTRLPR